MSKDTMISFRTTNLLNESLKTMAEENKTTLSGLIGSVLDEYLSSRTAQKILDQDRRKFSRRNDNIPAVVEYASGAFQTARITSLSLGGAGLTVPEPAEISPELPAGQEFEVVFPLPGARHPVVISCQATWIGDGGFQIGAVFHDTDPAGYQTLLGYLT